jgi:hypothetical protein
VEGVRGVLPEFLLFPAIATERLECSFKYFPDGEVEKKRLHCSARLSVEPIEKLSEKCPIR